MTSGRRAAASRGMVISGYVVTAALFANLEGGVNAGVLLQTPLSSRASEAQPRDDTGIAGVAAHVIREPVHSGN